MVLSSHFIHLISGQAEVYHELLLKLLEQDYIYDNVFRRKRDEQSHAYSKIFPSFIIFFFLELDQINIQLFYSYSYIAELSSSLSPIFIYCAKTGVSNQSLNKGGIGVGRGGARGGQAPPII